MRFICVCLSAIWMIYGQTIATQKITVYDSYKILQAIFRRMEIMEENINSLVGTVSRIEQVFDCGKPTISDGHFEGISTYAHAVMVASCHEGYSLHGNKKITCTADGVWTAIPVCKPICNSPRVPNSRQYTENKEYPMGSEVDIQCNHGYEISRYSTYTITCVKGDIWSQDLVCLPVDCGRPPTVLNGSYSDGYSTTYNTTITLTCNKGFGKVGSEPFYCNGDGRWVGLQMCMRRVCVPMDDNSTECFFKNENFQLFNGRQVGEVSARNDKKCINECLRVDKQVSFIEERSFFCICYRRTDEERPYYYRGLNTLIRASEIDIVEKAYSRIQFGMMF
ncbi:Sushi [Mactra antiquata]